MSNKDNGGPAFPMADFDNQTFQHQTVDELKRLLSGMSLRDYFAAKAMQGILAGVLADGSSFGTDLEFPVADAAYKAADAMLAERSK